MLTPEEEITALKKQLEDTTLAAADAAKGGDNGSEELARLKTLNAELIAGRDKAKEAKRLAEQTALEEQGAFKELSEQLAIEKKALEDKISGQGEILAKIKERDEAKLQTLIATVPDNLKGLVENSTAPLAERIELAETLATVKPAGPNVRLPGDVVDQTLKEQHAAALASGDLPTALALKTKMFEKG